MISDSDAQKDGNAHPAEDEKAAEVDDSTEDDGITARTDTADQDDEKRTKPPAEQVSRSQSRAESHFESEHDENSEIEVSDDERPEPEGDNEDEPSSDDSVVDAPIEFKQLVENYVKISSQELNDFYSGDPAEGYIESSGAVAHEVWKQYLSGKKLKNWDTTKLELALKRFEDVKEYFVDLTPEQLDMRNEEINARDLHEANPAPRTKDPKKKVIKQTNLEKLIRFKPPKKSLSDAKHSEWLQRRFGVVQDIIHQASEFDVLSSRMQRERRVCSQLLAKSREALADTTTASLRELKKEYDYYENVRVMFLMCVPKLEHVLRYEGYRPEFFEQTREDQERADSREDARKAGAAERVEKLKNASSSAKDVELVQQGVDQEGTYHIDYLQPQLWQALVALAVVMQDKLDHSPVRRFLDGRILQQEQLIADNPSTTNVDDMLIEEFAYADNSVYDGIGASRYLQLFREKYERSSENDSERGDASWDAPYETWFSSNSVFQFVTSSAEQDNLSDRSQAVYDLVRDLAVPELLTSANKSTLQDVPQNTWLHQRAQVQKLKFAQPDKFDVKVPALDRFVKDLRARPYQGKNTQAYALYASLVKTLELAHNGRLKSFCEFAYTVFELSVLQTDVKPQLATNVVHSRFWRSVDAQVITDIRDTASKPASDAKQKKALQSELDTLFEQAAEWFEPRVFAYTFTGSSQVSLQRDVTVPALYHIQVNAAKLAAEFSDSLYPDPMKDLARDLPSLMYEPEPMNSLMKAALGDGAKVNSFDTIDETRQRIHTVKAQIAYVHYLVVRLNDFDSYTDENRHSLLDKRITFGITMLHQRAFFLKQSQLLGGALEESKMDEYVSTIESHLQELTEQSENDQNSRNIKLMQFVLDQIVYARLAWSQVANTFFLNPDAVGDAGLLIQQLRDLSEIMIYPAVSNVKRVAKAIANKRLDEIRNIGETNEFFLQPVNQSAFRIKDDPSKMEIESLEQSRLEAQWNRVFQQYTRLRSKAMLSSRNPVLLQFLDNISSEQRDPAKILKYRTEQDAVREELQQLTHELNMSAGLTRTMLAKLKQMGANEQAKKQFEQLQVRIQSFASWDSIVNRARALLAQQSAPEVVDLTRSSIRKTRQSRTVGEEDTSFISRDEKRDLDTELKKEAKADQTRLEQIRQLAAHFAQSDLVYSWENELRASEDPQLADTIVSIPRVVDKTLQGDLEANNDEDDTAFTSSDADTSGSDSDEMLPVKNEADTTAVQVKTEPGVESEPELPSAADRRATRSTDPNVRIPDVDLTQLDKKADEMEDDQKSEIEVNDSSEDEDVQQAAKKAVRRAQVKSEKRAVKQELASQDDKKQQAAAESSSSDSDDDIPLRMFPQDSNLTQEQKLAIAKSIFKKQAEATSIILHELESERSGDSDDADDEDDTGGESRPTGRRRSSAQARDANLNSRKFYVAPDKSIQIEVSRLDVPDYENLSKSDKEKAIDKLAEDALGAERLAIHKRIVNDQAKARAKKNRAKRQEEKAKLKSQQPPKPAKRAESDEKYFARIRDAFSSARLIENYELIDSEKDATFVKLKQSLDNALDSKIRPNIKDPLSNMNEYIENQLSAILELKINKWLQLLRGIGADEATEIEPFLQKLAALRSQNVFPSLEKFDKLYRSQKDAIKSRNNAAPLQNVEQVITSLPAAVDVDMPALQRVSSSSTTSKRRMQSTNQMPSKRQKLPSVSSINSGTQGRMRFDTNQSVVRFKILPKLVAARTIEVHTDEIPLFSLMEPDQQQAVVRRIARQMFSPSERQLVRAAKLRKHRAKTGGFFSSLFSRKNTQEQEEDSSSGSEADTESGSESETESGEENQMDASKLSGMSHYAVSHAKPFAELALALGVAWWVHQRNARNQKSPELLQASGSTVQSMFDRMSVPQHKAGFAEQVAIAWKLGAAAWHARGLIHRALNQGWYARLEQLLLHHSKKDATKTMRDWFEMLGIETRDDQSNHMWPYRETLRFCTPHEMQRMYNAYKKSGSQGLLSEISTVACNMWALTMPPHAVRQCLQHNVYPAMCEASKQALQKCTCLPEVLEQQDSDHDQVCPCCAELRKSVQHYMYPSAVDRKPITRQPASQSQKRLASIEMGSEMHPTKNSDNARVLRPSQTQREFERASQQEQPMIALHIGQTLRDVYHYEFDYSALRSALEHKAYPRFLTQLQRQRLGKFSSGLRDTGDAWVDAQDRSLAYEMARTGSHTQTGAMFTFSPPESDDESQDESEVDSRFSSQTESDSESGSDQEEPNRERITKSEKVRIDFEDARQVRHFVFEQCATRLDQLKFCAALALQLGWSTEESSTQEVAYRARILLSALVYDLYENVVLPRGEHYDECIAELLDRLHRLQFEHLDLWAMKPEMVQTLYNTLKRSSQRADFISRLFDLWSAASGLTHWALEHQIAAALDNNRYAIEYVHSLEKLPVVKTLQSIRVSIKQGLAVPLVRSVLLNMMRNSRCESHSDFMQGRMQNRLQTGNHLSGLGHEYEQEVRDSLEEVDFANPDSVADWYVGLYQAHPVDLPVLLSMLAEHMEPHSRSAQHTLFEHLQQQLSHVDSENTKSVTDALYQLWREHTQKLQHKLNEEDRGNNCMYGKVRHEGVTWEPLQNGESPLIGSHRSIPQREPEEDSDSDEQQMQEWLQRHSQHAPKRESNSVQSRMSRMRI